MIYQLYFSSDQNSYDKQKQVINIIFVVVVVIAVSPI